ncbi:hypothetical protein PR003_g15768 [Phytophthora rubi]|uniref:Reverse transcriptase Ty1/copia-type domain-containing protein n=1 Tax=Phytophthora rubi TaxID=129364 RepID=A0A6A4F5Y0_9STRA|nr:hypothetical protein PR001_g25117 [Phytophthora rubi]KAE9014483.1 hypothetical protein PR002_g14212 [Phytophthora rubi]KAE9328556.1 hypothetical protein PR003_g15768 [Phytophthora rubi]
MEEMAALNAECVIEEIPEDEVPEDAKLVNTMCVYALKSDQYGYVVRFKARIVALCNFQRPVLVLDQKISVCHVNGRVHLVLKAVYGLHQSGREWNSELSQWFLDQGYQRSFTEPCLYFNFEGEIIVYVLGYVDDIFVATNDESYKEQLFKGLNDAYDLKDQRRLTQYLGVDVQQTRESIKISQGKDAREILEKFGYQDAHGVGNLIETNVRLAPLEKDEKSETNFPYREAIGMLMYLATSTHPDLACTLGKLSRFVANSSATHVGAVNRVLWYLVGTVDYGITYARKQEEVDEVVLDGYSDSDWANDPE